MNGVKLQEEGGWSKGNKKREERGRGITIQQGERGTNKEEGPVREGHGGRDRHLPYWEGGRGM